MAKGLTIKVAELMKPLSSSTVKPGTTLGDFLTKKGVKIAQVRVNGVVKPGTYALKAGDLLCIVGEVSGGR